MNINRTQGNPLYRCSTPGCGWHHPKENEKCSVCTASDVHARAIKAINRTIGFTPKPVIIPPQPNVMDKTEKDFWLRASYMRRLKDICHGKSKKAHLKGRHTMAGKWFRLAKDLEHRYETATNINLDGD